MTSKEKQVKNGMIYLLPVVVGNLLPLITLPIFTRILTKEDYGVWALAQVYAVFVTGIANFGLTTGYERNYFEYRDPDKAAKLLYSTLVFVVFVFIVFGVFTFIYKQLLAQWIIGSGAYADILFWSYCAAGLVSLKMYYLIYFKNSENAKSYAWFTIDENLLGVVFSLVLVGYLKTGVIGLVWGQLLASGTVFTVLTARFLRTFPASFDFDILKDSLKLSVPLTPRIFLGAIGSQFDKYLIGLLSSLGGVGIYNIGQKVANGVFSYMTAIQNVYFPQVYRRMFDSGEDGGKQIGRYLTPFLYISIAVALTVALLAEEIIMILTPPTYHDATDIVIILTLLFGTYFFGKQPQLTYAKKTYLTSALTALSIILNIIINIPFIKMWGAIGAAWGTLLAGLISGTISFVVSQRYYKINWEYGKVGLICLIFFVAAMLMILFRYYGISYELRLAVKIVSLSCYVYLGAHLKILTKQNYLLLKNVFIPAKTHSGII